MDLLTLKEAAKQFRRSPKVFARHVRANGIPFVQMGNRMLFDPTVIVAYLTTSVEPSGKTILFSPVVKRGSKASRFARDVGVA
jgi:excisionase family DNA binding protein